MDFPDIDPDITEQGNKVKARFEKPSCFCPSRCNVKIEFVENLEFFIEELQNGIFVALALRFDVSRGIKNRYFNSAFLGYTLGLTVTIIVMNWFQAAQPALLYIVPGVIGFVAVHCLWNGEVKQLLEFDESKAEAEETSEEDSANDSSKQSKKVD